MAIHQKFSFPVALDPSMNMANTSGWEILCPVAFTAEWNGGILKQGSWVVPKGAKDQYWSMKVLAMMSDPKRQAANAEVLGYSGMHLDSNQYVAEKIRPLLPLFPDNLKKQLWLDQEWWTKNGAEMGERWNKWMLSKA
jgi:putative spermidine/putrescine transport system substrate-binding protein